jgi:transcriptional regulator with XRE-family HTH domain
VIRKIKEVKPQLNVVMKERGLTQTQLEEMSDVPQTIISRFDKQENHKDIHVIRLLDALDITIKELFQITYEE